MPLLSQRQTSRRHSQGRQALSVALIYAVFASLWILLSDRVAGWLLQDPAQLVLVGTLKGWLFVACTSLLLYLLLYRLPFAGNEQNGLGLRRQIPWRSLTLLLSTIAVLTALSIGKHYQNEKQVAHAQLRAIADLKSQQLGQWLRERQSDIELLQTSVGLRLRWQDWQASPTAQPQAVVEERLLQYTRSGQFQRAAVIGADQRALWYPRDTPASVRQDPVLQAAVQASLQGGPSQRVGPWLDASGTARLAFVAPLQQSAHERPSVVVLQVDLPPHFHPILNSWPLPQKSAETLLLRRDGDDALFLNELKHEPNTALRKRRSLTQTQTQALSSQTLAHHATPGTLLEGADYRGVPVLAVSLPVPGTDWWLTVKQDRDELMTGAVIDGLLMLLTALLAFFAVGVAVYLYVQHRRLQQTEQDVVELQHTRAQLMESEARYRLLAENGADVIWLFDLQAFRCTYVSPSVTKLIGHTPAEVMQLRLENSLTPASLALVHDTLPKRLAAYARGDESLRTQTNEIWHLHKDGRAIPTELVTTLLKNEDGDVVHVLGVSRDITIRKATAAQITRLSQATEQSPASVVITNLKGEIEYVNQAFEHISGYSRQEVVGKNPRFLQSGKTPRDVYRTMWRTLLAGETWSGEIINRHRDGHEYLQSVTLAPVRNDSGDVTNYLSVQLDVTAQRQAEAKAHQLAWFDALTDLPNRHHLISELSNTLAADRRAQRQSVLMLLNLDRFKNLNDALGHSSGDRLLKLVGERLSTQVLHAGDMLARVGADEFALLMHGGHTSEQPTANEAIHLAQALHDALATPFALPDSRTINVTASIGVTLLPHQDNDQPGDVLRRVNTALHRAKRAGGHQTAFFDATMGQVVSQRFAIEQDLRRGLAAGELRLFLQPQVDKTGRMVSAEALVRWQHPDQGLVPPGLFIPVAEESDLIIHLGHWVLKEVCTHLGQLHREHKRLTVAVNISPRQFHQPGFTAELLQLLDETGAAPGDLILEITEGVVLEQVEEVIERMNELTRHGIRFSIDDFGTGYSALSYLKKLPIHELKIDRSFVQDAPRDPNGAALVEAILSVARHLRLRVVAEGVETEAQAHFFDAHPHVLMQGYLYGRPEPVAVVLARWQTPASPEAD